jgi:hypothetical protein
MVAHGYAVTAHRSQGTTVDRAFVYADGPFMDKEKTYVALTRGREGNRLYADRASLGSLSWEQQTEMRRLPKEKRREFVIKEYQQRLIEQMSKSGEKLTTFPFREDDIHARSLTKVDQALAGVRSFSKNIKSLALSYKEGSKDDKGYER